MNHPTNRAFAGKLARRKAIAGAAALSAAFLALPQGAFAAAYPTPSLAQGVQIKGVTFKNQAINMAGNLHTPKGFDKAAKYATVVVVHPGGGVKEQAAGLYAQRFAEQGFVALTFDASHQGASGAKQPSIT
jgi:dipeptidyl aminopeptidase/acylaminoacyl peptidase